MPSYHNSQAPDFDCPVCGESVPAKAKSCPNCGADERAGWNDSLEDSLPDESFSYDEFVKREFGGAVKPMGLKWYWWVTAIVLLAWLILSWVW
jgi:hypothetical protein